MFELYVRSFAWGFDTSLKAALIALIAAAALRLLRFQDSNIRHRVWTGVLAGMIALPVLTPLMPALRLPLVPSPEWLVAWTAEPVAAEAVLPAEPDESVIVSSPVPTEPQPSQASTSLGDRWQLPPGGFPRSSAVPSSETTIENRPLLPIETVAERPRSTSLALQPAPRSGPSRRTIAFAAVIFAGGIWLFISALLTLRLAIGVWMAARLRQASIGITLSERVEGSASVSTVRECPAIRVPLTVGWLRPQILLPPEWHKWPVDKLRAVLAHEQMHVQRADCLVALVAEMNCCLYWFHPLAWWLKQQLAVLAEQACDDAAIDSIGDRARYARHLLEVAAAALHHRGRFAPAGVSMARRSNVESRIHAILDFTRPLSRRLTWASTLLLLAVMVPLIALAAALQPAGSKQPGENPNSATSQQKSAEDNTIIAPPNAPVAEASLEGTGKTPADDSAITFAGTVVGDREQRVADATISFGYSPRATAAGGSRVLATTDAQGKFHFSKKRSELESSDGEISWLGAGLIATKPGYGLAVGNVRYFDISGRLEAEMTERERELALYEYGKKSTVLTLVPDDVPVRGRVLDSEGRPIAGAKIELASIWQGTTGNLDAWEAAAKQPGADALAANKELRPLSIAGYAMTGDYPLSASHLLVVPPVRTGDDGWFTLKGLGRDRVAQLYVSGQGIATMPLNVRSQRGEALELVERRDMPALGNIVYHPAEFTCIASPSIPVIGRVTDKRTGQPLAGYVVRGYKIATNEVHGGLEAMFIHTRTDADGHYRLEGLPLGENVFHIGPPDGSPHLASNIEITTSVGSPPLVRDVALSTGVKARGRVTDSRTGRPLEGNVTYFAFETNPHLQEATGFDSAHHQYRAGADGRFEIPVLPGPGILGFRADNVVDYPRGIGAEKIDGPKEVSNAVFFMTVPWRCAPDNFHVVAPLNPPSDAADVNLDLVLAPGDAFTARVRTADGQPLSNYYVHGDNNYGPWNRREAETFQVKCYFPKDGRRIIVYQPERNLVGYRDVTGDAPESIEIVVRPGGTLIGRIVDADGLPVENHSLYSDWGNENFRTLYSPAVVKMRGPLTTYLDGFSARADHTDKEGRFELKGIIPGLSYTAGVSGPTKMYGRTQTMHLGRIFTDAVAESGQTIDLGDLRIKRDEPKEQGEPKAAEPKAAEPKPVPAVAPAPAADATLTYAGRVVDAEGNPVANARLSLEYKRVTQPALEPGPRYSATSDDDGQFQFTVPQSELRKQSRDDYWNSARVVAVAAGFGFDEVNVSKEVVAKPITLKLVKDVPIRGRILDLEGRPVAGASVRVKQIRWMLGKTLDAFLAESSDTRALFPFDRFSSGPAEIRDQVTGPDGRFTLTGVGEERFLRLEVAGATIEHAEIEVVTRDYPAGPSVGGDPANSKRLYGATFEHLAAPSRPIVGTVRDAATGQPVVGATVHGRTSHVPKTDEAGRYQLLGYPKSPKYHLQVFPPEGQPYFRASVTIDDSPGLAPLEKTIELSALTIARGRVIDKRTGQPVEGRVEYYALYPNAHVATLDRVGRPASQAKINSDGQFAISVFPGPGVLAFQVDALDKWGYQPAFVSADELKTLFKGNTDVEYDATHLSIAMGGTARSAIGQSSYHALVLIDPADGQPSLITDVSLEPAGSVRGTVLDADGQPLVGATAYGLTPQSNFLSKMLTTAEFESFGARPERPVTVLFLHEAKKLGAAIAIRGDETDLTVRLQPLGEATGRLLTKDGEPATDVTLNFNRSRFYGPGILAKTDQEGRFRVEGLAIGQKYDATLRDGQQGIVKIIYSGVSITPPQTTDLGDVTLR